MIAFIQNSVSHYTKKLKVTVICVQFFKLLNKDNSLYPCSKSLIELSKDYYTNNFEGHCQENARNK